MEKYSTIFDSSSSSTPQNPHLLSPMNMVMNHHQHQQQQQQLLDHNYLQDHHNKNIIDHQHVADEGEMENEAAKGTGKKLKHVDKKSSRKPRYAFQTRSQVDILDDGYRWRKYGQKAVKNNKFPRSYYRCTYQGCNVKKQIQRLSRDEEIVVTTYEGMHSHPIEKSNDNFEHILTQMQIYNSTF